MPVPLVADVLTTRVSPPQLSGTSSNFVSCCSTRSGLASGLSILLRATRIGTSAACAWRMASSVCGMTPSSAATTSTTISGHLGPARAHLRERGVPGVSRKVMVPFLGTFT